MTSGMRSNNWRPSSTPTPPKTRRHIHHRRTQTARIRGDLQQWHIHRQQRIAQEHERYAQHELPYKAICHVNDAMTDTGHCTITTVRQGDGSFTSDPATVLQATQDSFLHQHTPTQDTLDKDTQAKVERLPQVFNHARRRQLEKRPFTIHEVRKAIHSLRQHKTPGYDGLPAEAYYHLPAHLLRILAHRLWDIVTGEPPCHQTGQTLSAPSTKTGTGPTQTTGAPKAVQSRRSKLSGPSSCAAFAPICTPAYPPASWAIPGRSPHDAILLQDTIANVDPVDLIIASLDVKEPSRTPPGSFWRRCGNAWASPSTTSPPTTSAPANTQSAPAHRIL